jgi:hypothetical protein
MQPLPPGAPSAVIPAVIAPVAVAVMSTVIARPGIAMSVMVRGSQAGLLLPADAFGQPTSVTVSATDAGSVGVALVRLPLDGCH